MGKKDLFQGYITLVRATLVGATRYSSTERLILETSSLNLKGVAFFSEAFGAMGT